MSETEKKSVAALLYVTLRRVANRVIDVEWMGKNEDYAREVIHLAREQGSEELKHYANRYEVLAFGSLSQPMPPGKPTPAVKPSIPAEAAKPVASERPDLTPIEEETDEDDGALPGHYIGTLR